MSFNSFMQTVAFSPKDVEKSNAFFKKLFIIIVMKRFNSGKLNVLTKIQYYDTLITLPQHS